MFPLIREGGCACAWGALGTLAALLPFTPPPAAGDSVTVSCEALSELPELTLLYWLENGFFVKSLHPDGAVREGTVQEELQGSGMALHRDLHFSSFDNQHLHTNFTCMVLSPFGVDTREVRWLSQALAPVTGKSGGLG
ncbi:interleukin-18-binding protein [Vidua macroura]|uniref:interleukin-18-binding protein n=1 Tax=Vidua macroura TaxID=187451 RepID=UPI0023A7DEA3|nr:interleukin-18-binding protein [Vidua macroura]